MTDKSHPDWSVLEKIGRDTLVAAGIHDYLIKSWRYRGVPWSARSKIARLARSCRIRVPKDFDLHKPVAPSKERASAA